MELPPSPVLNSSSATYSSTLLTNQNSKTSANAFSFGDRVEVDFWKEDEYHISGFLLSSEPSGSSEGTKYTCVRDDGSMVEIQGTLRIRRKPLDEAGVLSAIQVGLLQPVAQWLDNGGLPDFTIDSGQLTPLHWAALKGNSDICRLLVNNGANVNADAGAGFTPLHAACGSGDQMLVGWLLGKADTCDQTDFNGRTPADWARCAGHWDLAEHPLLSCSFKFDMDNEDTELSERNREWPFLVGDRISYKNKNGEWVRGFIDESYHQMLDAQPLAQRKVVYKIVTDNGEVVNALPASQLRCEPMLQPCFLLAATVGAVATLSMWARCGGDVNLQDDNGWTALHFACDVNLLRVVACLVEECQADTAIVAPLFGTAFDRAFMNANVHVINYIVKHNAGKQLLRDGKSAMSVSQSLVLNHFIRSLKQHLECIDLQNIFLLKVDDFLSAGRFLHHNECISQGLLHLGKAISATSKILFISHRWEAKQVPDPHGNQFEMAKGFIESQGKDKYDFVWIDYSCICQDLTSTQFNLNLMNIPTCIFASTHCLVIPKLVDIPPGISAAFKPNTSSSIRWIAGEKVTDLQDYLGRAWCQFEALACMITGCEVYCCFWLSTKIQSYVEITGDWYETGDGWFTDGKGYSASGFKGAALKAVKQCSELKEKEMKSIWRAFLQEWWFSGSNEPTANIENAVGCLQNLIQNRKDLFEKVLSMSLEQQDLDANKFISAISLEHDSLDPSCSDQENLTQDTRKSEGTHAVLQKNSVSYSLSTVARELGDLHDEKDRILILKLVLFTLVYCMNKIPQRISSLDQLTGMHSQRSNKMQGSTPSNLKIPALSTGDTSYPSFCTAHDCNTENTRDQEACTYRSEFSVASSSHSQRESLSEEKEIFTPHVNVKSRICNIT